ncbi:hypothetical protein K7X08_007451 [Anisodus acutangulus]|uniref:YqaJ viral recombinase domain-containing protein n=1 Tax=Anisodus acutangulus TaxID=402998 RepID=A0A9Q1LFP3_9SOLA|nr:hypothetical protein K7X08_007451 [Anisodus acutangulus]
MIISTFFTLLLTAATLGSLILNLFHLFTGLKLKYIDCNRDRVHYHLEAFLDVGELKEDTGLAHDRRFLHGMVGLYDLIIIYCFFSFSTGVPQNSHLIRFSSIQKAAVPLPGRSYHGIVFLRSFSTLTAPCVPLSYPPPSLVSVACLTQSNAPQRSDEWFALRKDKLTTSTFSTALGFWKGNRRNELWHEKVFAPDVQFLPSLSRSAMDWRVLMEAVAIERYKSITDRDVSSLGFAIHSDERLCWVGASRMVFLEICQVAGS